MPKISKSRSKKSFDLGYVRTNLDSWMRAANLLEEEGKKAYQNIRNYVPRYERSMTPTERIAVAELCSKFLKSAQTVY